ncbi:hypothetical protein M1M30_gp150 [Maribacter phage Colly_1]|uniref:Uncharacterized protein n=1 Tax=Maribacter phage Colly_1 TaxID=2745691 RepID=A0A8E4UXW0_9CAUD|nr:hypothetical protein M1M30_gp150 [Maribacter phage Colly_1]QQO97252.1 hypothetical protein Colly1_150 [Maribacter phage Colly_1]
MGKTIKYKKEIDSILREVLYEDWMTEEEYSEFITSLLQESKISYEDLAADLDKGIANGHSLEWQVQITKNTWKGLHRNPSKQC